MIASVLARLEASGNAVAALSEETLAAIPWIGRAPSDYGDYLRRFGGTTVRLFCWSVPAATERSELEQSFVGGGPPTNLVPIAEQDGTWFMAFDLSARSRLVEWDHEKAVATPYEGSFAAWLSEQLDQEAAADDEEQRGLSEQRRWAEEHVPFVDTSFGKLAVARLGTRIGPTLRDVLLDLHLQYTFHPRVVVRDGVRYLGMLHFTETTIGCWRCGRMNEKEARTCARCTEPLLQRTFVEGVTLPPHQTAWDPCFGVWALTQVDIDAPQPRLVSHRLHPQGIPKWARLTVFGGTRDPRVATDAEWEPPAGDTF